jgi:hypothetical protein
MIVQANRTMSTILDENQYDFPNSSIDIPEKLQVVLDAGFREEQECILFRDFVYFGPGELTLDFDKTSYEDFLNYIDLNGYVTETTSKFDTLKIGLGFGKKLYHRLKDSFQTNFRVIISLENSQDHPDQSESIYTCVVRFHSIRKNSDAEFRNDNLELYDTEGIIILE